MRKALAAAGMAALLLAALAPGVSAVTTKLPFDLTSSQVVGFTPPVESFLGHSYHADGMVLVIEQVGSTPLVSGTMTITVSYVFGGGWGDNAWGSETLASSTYPGEGYTCSLHGQWLKDGTRHMYDHCFGYGDHLSGWQFESDITAINNVDVAFDGVIWNAGQ